MSDNNETWYVEPRPINAYELAEQVRNSMDYNPHKDLKIARNHRLEHEHFLRLIAAEPTLDPVKHAQWIDIYGGKYANPRYACSSCGGKALWDNVQDELLSWHEVQVLSDFCPHCGAKMDGGKDD